MTPHVRIGLTVGVVGLFINLVVSTIVGLCGPLVTLAAGAVAGLLSARAAVGAPRNVTAQRGAVAGVVAGGLMVVGQVVGAFLALWFIQQSGTTPFGQLPDTESAQVGYILGGALVGLCFGIVGMGLAAGAGALAAYLAWREAATIPSP